MQHHGAYSVHVKYRAVEGSVTHSFVDEHLRTEVETFIRERFDTVQIISVEVAEDCDRDRDRVLSIRVTFAGTPKELAQKEPPGFLSKLRERLVDLHESAFPVVTFRPSAF